MVPGMFHCGGGDGASEFDGLRALERWYEDQEAPEQLIASRTLHGKVVATHLLCAYPATARYQAEAAPKMRRTTAARCRNAPQR